MAAYFHRKTLQKSMEPFVVIKACLIDHCGDDGLPLPLPPLPPPPPPPPPLPPLSSNHPLSLYLIILFCGLAVSFSFICYFTICTIYRRRQRNRESTDEIQEDFVNQDHGPVIHHPIWLINTIGLDQSQIDSIQVVKYKKDDGLIEGTDCSVCLSEFEDDESLRLLPKCSHAFHVPCIDTWLRSHKNCPLCRAPIIKNSTDHETDHNATIELNSTESRTSDENPGGDSENFDDRVFRDENNGEMEKTYDRDRVEEEEFVATRRSVSMDEFSSSSRQLVVSKKPMVPKVEHKLKGSSSMSIRDRLMKSSSIDHSSRKASSFTKRSYSSSGMGR